MQSLKGLIINVWLLCMTLGVLVMVYSVAVGIGMTVGSTLLLLGVAVVLERAKRHNG